MVSLKSLSLRVGLFIVVLFLVPWFLSLGTYFSGYAHFEDDDHDIILNAKSGFYKTIHSYEGQVYRVHRGIYASLGDSLYFFSLDGDYEADLDPEFAAKVVASDLENYFRGLTHVGIVEKEGRTIGLLQKDNIKKKFDQVVIQGRLKVWD
ncbi:hypothetical protein [Vibrio crassostreae]|uniref:hypothetical protein n=1 Tax=Vibrio crassostreae TaxID=246167 RepID=UPI000F46B610|nr:hypothetical protein [Vibrio crassostreae]NOI52543.1 hypothetical protein [Vibrio crassostreae]ROR08994.1 hypothetical protein EDB36_11438 [Vibrio crassostreae]TCN76167.1 hypothetical protein EDB62_11058 [Vibrio crassostreae]TCO00244.1 hypothetical protein EDB51_10919 [Vibrio crassostreae]TCV24936.1 hypothetical protein EDB71_11022 [Vibrio crassostreae]